MSSWSSGYVVDIDYTYGYYQELNPLRLAQAFLSAGIAWPEVRTACELGYGQGVSINIHAAASAAHWHGTDFNPAQAAFAQSLAAASGAPAALADQSFAEFAQRSDLPDFDFIGLHGIWSWISDENRHHIVDLVRRRLKPGGVLYISYNTLPGWTAMLPLQHLLQEHYARRPGEQGVLEGVDAALAFAESLLATDPRHARAHPQVARLLERVKAQDRHYVAHEYFNRNWQPMPYASMARWLEPAKLSFVAAARYIDHIDALMLTPSQQAFLKGVTDPVLRQTARDFMVDRQFRCDYWVKGARRLGAAERAERLRALRVVLTCERKAVSSKVEGGLRQATMHEKIYAPVLDLMADHRPRTLGEIEQAVRGRGVSFADLTQAALVLGASATLAPAQDAAAVEARRPHTEGLNAFLLERARTADGGASYLASPVIGGGIPVPRVEQLFLLAAAQGKDRPADWAAFAHGALEALGQRLNKDGKPIDSEPQRLQSLQQMADHFAGGRLPVLRALQVA